MPTNDQVSRARGIVANSAVWDRDTNGVIIAGHVSWNQGGRDHTAHSRGRDLVETADNLIDKVADMLAELEGTD